MNKWWPISWLINYCVTVTTTTATGKLKIKRKRSLNHHCTLPFFCMVCKWVIAARKKKHPHEEEEEELMNLRVWQIWFSCTALVFKCHWITFTLKEKKIINTRSDPLRYLFGFVFEEFLARSLLVIIKNRNRTQLAPVADIFSLVLNTVSPSNHFSLVIHICAASVVTATRTTSRMTAATQHRLVYYKLIRVGWRWELKNRNLRNRCCCCCWFLVSFLIVAKPQDKNIRNVWLRFCVAVVQQLSVFAMYFMQKCLLLTFICVLVFLLFIY